MNGIEIERRALLRHAITLAALACIAGCKPLGAIADAAPQATAEMLQDCVVDQAAAARLGRVYLDRYPEERNQDRLLDAIDAAARPFARSVDADAVFESIATAVRADYLAGATVWVGDWILSRTEARLYAVEALAG